MIERCLDDKCRNAADKYERRGAAMFGASYGLAQEKPQRGQECDRLGGRAHKAELPARLHHDQGHGPSHE